MFGGLLAFVLGLLFGIYLDHLPAPEVHWAAGALGALLMFGGIALCVTGIVLVAIAASRPRLSADAAPAAPPG